MMDKSFGKIFSWVSIFVFCAVATASVYAYGGGGSRRSSSCTAPSFSEETPAKDAVVSSFSGFSLLTSSNTDGSTVVTKINGEAVDPTITEKRYGGLKVEANAPKPITTEGPVIVSITANSEPGCSKSYVYRVHVKP